MRIVTGLLLLGCSAAAVVAWLPQETLPIQLSVVTTEGSNVFARVEPMAAEAGASQRTFASSVPLAQGGGVAQVPSVDAKVPSIRRVVPPANSSAAEAHAPATVQQVGPPAQATPAPAAVAEASPRAAAPLPAPAAGVQRADLARSLQRELKRVGCYQGDVTGEWNAASKKAMQAFNERLNASLPVEEPDYILLTLVQGQSSRTCGQSCPAGQSMAGDGRCIPNVILAQPKSKPIEPQTRTAGRDAVAGPAHAGPALVAQPAPAQRSRWSDTVVAAPTQRPLPQAQPYAPPPQPSLAMPAPQPNVPVGSTPPPLPGRMAMGRGPGEEAASAIGPNGQPIASGVAVDDAGIPPPAAVPVRRPPSAPRPVTAQRGEPAKTWAKHIFNN